ncbi:MAG: DUF2917 domain-containing protein [Gemmatimonadota bacterium]
MTGEWGPTTSRTVDLGYEQMLVLEGRPGTRVRVLFGGIWLTEQGLLDDMFVHTGEEVALQSRQRSLIEGLGATRLEVIEPVLGGYMQRIGRAAGVAMRGLIDGAKSLMPQHAWAPRVPRGTLAALAAVVGVAIPAMVAVGIVATAPTLAQFI